MKQEDIQASDHAYYGKLLLKLNEDSLASESFVRSLELDSTQQDILKIHGGNLLQNKRFAEAADVYEQLIALKEVPLLQDLWYLGQAYYFDGQYLKADSALNKIMARQSIEKLPHQVLLFSARSKANIDSTMTAGLAKPAYEALLKRISKNISKYETEVIEAYTYLGAYYVHEEENIAKAKDCFEKILELDSSNPTAKEFMKTISIEAAEKGG
jgi:Tfp pilus assembly protein PilF